MIASALQSSDFTSYAAVSYERSVQIDATLTTSDSGTEFTASVEISISLEARAVLQTEAISQNLNALLKDQDAPDDRLGRAGQDVLQVLSLVAGRQISAEAGSKLLDASETYREAIQDLLEEVNERSLDSQDIDRLNKAEDAFNGVSAAVLGGPPNDTQEVLSKFIDRITRKATKAARQILKGHDPVAEQERLIKHVEKAFARVLDKIF